MEADTIELAIIAITVLICIWGLVRVMNAEDNPIYWWHFVAARGEDGTQYGDLNSLGLLIGVIASTIMVMWATYRHELEWWQWLLWLTFIGGVKTFGTWLRSKVGAVALPGPLGQVLGAPAPPPTDKPAA